MNKKSTINLILSAFLVTAFVVCTYFFSTIGLTGNSQKVCNILITVVFGFVLFYATRVGEGKAVFRFSLPTLIILDIPVIYILLTSLATGLPLSEFLGASDIVVRLAGVSLGYGIPYTFLSGFEIQEEEADENEEEKDEESDEAENPEEEDAAVAADVEEAADGAEADGDNDPAVEINI